MQQWDFFHLSKRFGSHLHAHCLNYSLPTWLKNCSVGRIELKQTNKKSKWCNLDVIIRRFYSHDVASMSPRCVLQDFISSFCKVYRLGCVCISSFIKTASIPRSWMQLCTLLDAIWKLDVISNSCWSLSKGCNGSLLVISRKVSLKLSFKSRSR